MKTSCRIEILESRIAPATLTGNILTYTDADGDGVSIVFGTPAALTANVFTFDSAFESTGPQQLQVVHLASLFAAEGCSITMKVTQSGGGNGRADLGFINAQGIDLAKVSLAGDLGRIVAGDDDSTPALKLLGVYSMGVAGLDTQGGTGSLDSVLSGSVGAVKIVTDFVDGSISLPVVAGRGTKLGSLTIGDDLAGGDSAAGGSVTVSGSIGKVLIRGSIVGGAEASTGSISAGAIGSVVIGTSANAAIRGEAPVGIQGGVGSGSGVIKTQNSIKKVVIFGGVAGEGTGSGSIISNSGSIGSITIHGSLVGGNGDRSGVVSADLTIGKVAIDGDLFGGSGSSAGTVESGGGIGSISIGESIKGGASFNSGTISSQRSISSVRVADEVLGGDGTFSGAIRSDGFLGSVVIAGNVTGGMGDQSGLIHAGLMGSVSIGGGLTSGPGLRSGMIESDNSIASVKITGNVQGTAAVPATIVARGAVKPTSTADVAIGTIKLGGKAEFLNVLAGFDETSLLITQQIPPGVNGNAQIKSIKIGSTAAGVNIIAGVLPGLDGAFGTGDEAPYGDFTDAIDPVIGKLTIGGQWLVTADSSDSFMITADRILKASVNGAGLPLSSANDSENIALSADSKLVEFV